MKTNRFCICLPILLLTLAACSGGQPTAEPAAPESATAGQEAVQQATETATDTAPGQELPPAPEPAGQEEPQAEEPAVAQEETPDPDAEPLSLAQRLCGKYSSLQDSGEYAILEIVEFADNLYAFAGEAMPESSELEAYSFWAQEILPADAETVRSDTASSCDVGVLSFSIMSNLSRYQGPPERGTIRLTDDGLDLLGTHYERNERVSDSFPYVSEQPSGEEDLIGLWRQRDSADPFYLGFEDDRMWLYSKSPDKEVLLGCGGYQAKNGYLSGTYNLLGSGTMPYQFKAEYRQETNGELTLFTADNELATLFSCGEICVFEPVRRSDVPIFTLQDAYDAGFTDARNYDMYRDHTQIDERSFYGVWTSAFIHRGEAEEALAELNDRGFEGSIVLSSDWAGLNPSPRYCVTACRCVTEQAAKELLPRVRAAGYPEAYVKSTGERLSVTVDYTLYSLNKADVTPDRIWLYDIPVTDHSGTEDLHMDLLIDQNTVFDISCDMGPFDNYVKGDSVLDWYLRNDALLHANESDDASAALTLLGVFRAGLTGQHIDRLYGSYWWD